ncbi:hypothetical protein DNTS_005874, partial [Danionella cerebrum]
AGKLIAVGDTAKTSFQEMSRVVRKFVNSVRPPVGAVRVFHGKANDPDIASRLVHGVNTRQSINAASVINLTPKTLFQERLHQLQETTNKKAPLGRAQAQGLNFPSWLDPEKTTFGLKTFQSVSEGGAVINPPKTADQVKNEANEGHQLYVRSHGSYSVGERIDRKYDWSRCGKESKFGVPTPHHSDGRNISKCFQWPSVSLRHSSPKLSLKHSSEFRVKQQPEINNLQDSIAETLNVSRDHTFGVLTKPESFGVVDLLQQTPPGEYVKGKDRQRALLSAIQHKLKMYNYQKFNSLLEAFQFYDKKCQGNIDKEDLKAVCHEFNLTVSETLLDDLINYCDADKDEQINFLECLYFAGRRIQTAPASMQRTDLLEISTGSPLLCAEDLEPLEVGSIKKTPKTLSRWKTSQNHFDTSASVINAVVGRPSTSHYHTYGVPSVRTDLPAPRIKAFGDRTNYGDESTVHDLLHPPLLSLYGVHEEELFSPRSKDEMLQIFHKVGLDLAEETFEEAWKLASMKHPAGDVCVENLRNVLAQLQAH